MSPEDPGGPERPEKPEPPEDPRVVGPPSPRGLPVDRWFHVSRRGSTVAREVRGGVTTFMAMAYILLLNPVLLSVPDRYGNRLDPAAVITATALAAAVTTVAMGLIGRVPLALAAGLGVSGVLATQVAPEVSWPQAMGMCVIYGSVIILLVVTGMRERIMDAIPTALKHAITIGIGLFIAMVGLVNAGFVGLGEPGSPVTLGQGGRLAGWPVLAFCVTLLLTFMLLARGVPGALLVGIAAGTAASTVATAVLGIGDEEWGGAVPELPERLVSAPDFGLLGNVEIGGLADLGVTGFTMIVFTLVLAGFFDAMATIIAVGHEAGLTDERERMPGLGRALLVDGAGGVVGGVASASGQTVFVESAAGVGEGARTGLSAVVTGLLFAAALLFTPLALVVPGQVASAALVVIGAMMMRNSRYVDWTDRTTAIPVFLTVVLMPFTYSITTGIGAGVIAYTAVRTAVGRWREPGPLMWLLTAVFLVHFAVGGTGGGAEG
ncbi:NCS2 family permease [Streptomyces sp. HK10]|uniref:NCS2 family permease n=1 Tax=Streptomyces sp. HK10 TaxID=3373255 RepID=UPI00374A7921